MKSCGKCKFFTVKRSYRALDKKGREIDTIIYYGDCRRNPVTVERITNQDPYCGEFRRRWF